MRKSKSSTVSSVRVKTEKPSPGNLFAIINNHNNSQIIGRYIILTFFQILFKEQKRSFSPSNSKTTIKKEKDASPSKSFFDKEIFQFHFYF